MVRGSDFGVTGVAVHVCNSLCSTLRGFGLRIIIVQDLRLHAVNNEVRCRFCIGQYVHRRNISGNRVSSRSDWQNRRILVTFPNLLSSIGPLDINISKLIIIVNLKHGA